MTLGPHALHWFSLQPHATAFSPIQSMGANVKGEEEGSAVPTLTVTRTWENVFQGLRRASLTAALSRYLSRCPWLAGQPAVRSAAVRERVVLDADNHSIYLCLVDVEQVEGEPRTCVLPLTFTDDAHAETVLSRAHTVVARLEVRGEEGSSGILHDAMADPALRDRWVSALASNHHFTGSGGEVVAVAEKESAAPAATGQPGASTVVLRDEAWDTVIALGDRMVLKALRLVETGPHAEVEILRALQKRTSSATRRAWWGPSNIAPTRAKRRRWRCCWNCPAPVSPPGPSPWTRSADSASTS